MREKLAKWLNEHNMIPLQFSKLSGVPKSNIYGLLNGEIDPLNMGVTRGLAISRATGITLEEFFDDTVSQSEDKSTHAPVFREDELELIELWRNATPESRESVLMVLRCNQRVKKEAVI